MPTETENTLGEPEAIPHIRLSDVEFRGETIYFIVLDRFNRGASQVEFKESELDDPSRQDWNRYWGGNLQGVIDKLDYLQNMGVTALWLTPLFEQVEAISLGGTAPIHGYWTRDFKRINSRWVNNPDEVRLFSRHTVFDDLMEELHRRKMKFILDIVCNHSSPATTKGKGELFDDGKKIADFDDDKNNWYHHYGDVKDWNSEWQVQNCELAGLATFNENNTDYRHYITSAIKMWLDKGVDALRVDTVKHMPVWFWQEFNAEMGSHKPDIFVFGEWIYSDPRNPTSVEFANHSGMSLFDFGLCQAIRSCLGENAAAGFSLVQEIFNQDGNYRNATELVTFYENHDMSRLQSLGASNEMLDLATVLILTGRGIPCLFYGCEQYLHNDTNGGQDPYNRPMMAEWNEKQRGYAIVRRLSPERAKNPAILWGGHIPKLVERDTFAFVRRFHDHRCFVILNKGAERTIDAIDTELPNGRHQCLLSDSWIETQDGQAKGLHLGAGQALVFSFIGPRLEATSIARVQVNEVKTEPGDRVLVIGDCPELGNWDIAKGVPLEFMNSNTWFGELGFNESVGKSICYKFVVVHPGLDQAPLRENRGGRRRPIVEGTTKWRDVWAQ